MCCWTRFEDRERGGFFFTSHDHEQLFHRTKPGHDNATPSGNGVAARRSIALGHLCGEPRYVEAARARGARCSRRRWPHRPGGFSSLLVALERRSRAAGAGAARGRRRDERAPGSDALERRTAPAVRVLDVAARRPCPPALVKGAAPTRRARWRGSAAARRACRRSTRSRNSTRRSRRGRMTARSAARCAATASVAVAVRPAMRACRSGTIARYSRRIRRTSIRRSHERFAATLRSPLAALAVGRQCARRARQRTPPKR